MQRPAARVLDAVVLDAEPRRPRIEYSGIGAEARVLDAVVLDGRGAARVLDAQVRIEYSGAAARVFLSNVSATRVTAFPWYGIFQTGIVPFS